MCVYFVTGRAWIVPGCSEDVVQEICVRFVCTAPRYVGRVPRYGMEVWDGPVAAVLEKRDVAL